MGIYSFEHARERNKTTCNSDRYAATVIEDGYPGDSRYSYDVVEDRLDCDQHGAIAFRDEAL